MTDRFEISRRKALMGLGTIGVASAGAGLGTSALFSDEESFQENMITAGTLDLKVDYVVHEDQGSAGEYTINSFTGEVNGEASDSAVTLNGEGTAMSQTLEDVKPGDSGYSDFCFNIVDNPAYMWACGELTSSSENSYTEPEPEDENGEGELEEAIEVEVMYADINHTGGFVEEEGTIFSGTLREVLDQLNGGIPLDGKSHTGASAGSQNPFDASSPTASNPCLRFDWEVPTDVGNEIQGDSLTFDLQFYAEQARHNDGTHNPCLEGETGESWAKERRDFSPSVNARGRFGDNIADSGAYELDIRDAGDTNLATDNHGWENGETQSFEVSYDGSAVTLDVDGDTISTSDVSPSDDDAAITVGASDGTVTVENVQVNGQSPSGANGVSSSGATNHLFIAGGGLADGDSITGEVTFEWDGSPSDEGLKFRVDS